MKRWMIIAVVLASLPVLAEAEERVQNPCFASDRSGYTEEACSVCNEESRQQAETECAEEAAYADAIFRDVIYASTEDYSRIYNEWRQRVNRRDQCRIDLLLDCLNK